MRGIYNTCCKCETGGRKGVFLLQEMYVEACRLLPRRSGSMMMEWETNVEKNGTVSKKPRLVGF